MENAPIIESSQPQSQTTNLVKIIASNLIPIYGVIFWGWNAKQLVVAYIIETIIIVAIHFLRLEWVWLRYGQQPETIQRSQQLTAEGKETTIARGKMPFLFLGLSTVFLSAQIIVFSGFSYAMRHGNIIMEVPDMLKGSMRLTLISFAAIQVLYFLTEIVSNKYNHTPVEEVFWSPFKRIIILQLVVILSAFFSFSSTHFIALFILVLVKTTADLFTFFRSNVKLRNALTKGDKNSEKQWQDLEKIMKN